MARLTGYYYIKVDDVIRCENADGPRSACKKAFGVIYDKPHDTAEYKYVGTRRPGSLSAAKQRELKGPDGWKLLRDGSPVGSGRAARNAIMALCRKAVTLDKACELLAAKCKAAGIGAAGHEQMHNDLVDGWGTNDPDGELEHDLDQQYHSGKITYKEYEERRAFFRSAAEQEHPDDREARHCEEDERPHGWDCPKCQNPNMPGEAKCANCEFPKPDGPVFVVASLRRVDDGAFRELLYLVAAYRDQPARWTSDRWKASRFVGKADYDRAATYVRDCEKFGLTCFIHCEVFPG